jgi:ABC-type transport system involved in multi-copper enzyme maturation permease subunit
VQIVVAILCLGLLAVTYGLCARENLLADAGAHAQHAVLFLGIGVFFTAVLPATCITTERESRTWPLLLTTTLATRQILWGKAVGAMRRCAPAWLLLFFHLLVFVMVGIIHPVALVQVGGLVVWILLLLTSTGLYFSTRLRHTTTAVIANLVLAAGLWVIVPLFLQITLLVAGTGNQVAKIYTDLNPFTQVSVIMGATVGASAVSSYHWAQEGMKSLAEATGWMALTFAVYGLIGLAFLLRTASRLRRNPF